MSPACPGCGGGEGRWRQGGEGRVGGGRKEEEGRGGDCESRWRRSHTALPVHAELLGTVARLGHGGGGDDVDKEGRVGAGDKEEDRRRWWWGE